MKRLLRISDLSKDEQRVVLIVMLVVIAIAFVGYERRIHRAPSQTTSATEAKASPTVGKSRIDSLNPRNRKDEEE